MQDRWRSFGFGMSMVVSALAAIGSAYSGYHWLHSKSADATTHATIWFGLGGAWVIAGFLRSDIETDAVTSPKKRIDDDQS